MWAGFAYAAGAAIGHSCIDASRKWASHRFSDRELVALVALLDAFFLSSIALVAGSLDLHSLSRLDSDYTLALLVTAAIKAVASLMYQRALHVSPLSVTVPYLAFTPVLLVFTSYMIINELPSSQGLFGIVVVTLGGYFLAVDHPEVEVKKSDEPAKTVSVLSLVPWSSSKPGAGDKVPKVDGDGVVLDLSEKSSAAAPVVIHGANSASWLSQTQWEEGMLLMLGVAALLSISNSLDKMAAHLAPSVLNLAALQRCFTAVPVVLYLLVTSLGSHLSGGDWSIHLLPQEPGDSARLVRRCGQAEQRAALSFDSKSGLQGENMETVAVHSDDGWRDGPDPVRLIKRPAFQTSHNPEERCDEGWLMGTFVLPSPVPSPSLPRIRAPPRRKPLRHLSIQTENAGLSRKVRVSSQSSRQEQGRTAEESPSRGLPIETQSEAQPEQPRGDGGDGGEKQEQQQIGEALKELRKSSSSSSSVGFWDGLVQEIGMIEWPNPGKVFGTTLVVLGIIFGSSLVLVTVNFLLAELSDVVFKVQ